jgi:hypothetical protein
MSTVTNAAGWNALTNDIHGDITSLYSTVGEIPPKDGQTMNLMQKRGDMGVAEAAGGVIQGQRAVIDADDGDSEAATGYHGGTTWNDGTEGDPSDATGQGTVDRIDIPVKKGGARGITAKEVVPLIDATGQGMIFDTNINEFYAADESGNGGPELLAGTPTARPI